MDAAEAIKQADELEKQSKWEAELELLKPFEDKSEDLELLWRLIRAYNWVGVYLTKDKALKKERAKKVQEISDRAMKIDSNNFDVLRETIIMITWVSEMESMKVQVQQTHVMKEYLDKAIALNGSDPTIKHIMGRWCFDVASVSWIEKNIAKTLFATPPSSTHEEALKYFQEAEELSPDFYKGNWLYLGKSHLQLGNKEEAKKWIGKVLESKVEDPEDEEIMEDAKKVKKKL